MSAPTPDQNPPPASTAPNVPSGVDPLGPNYKLRLGAAYVLAICADCVQWMLAPIMVFGFLNPIIDVLDVFVAATMTGLLGWHWVFLPTFLGEMLPIADMMPLWTGAVMYVAAKNKVLHKEANPPSAPAALQPTPTSSGERKEVIKEAEVLPDPPSESKK